MDTEKRILGKEEIKSALESMMFVIGEPLQIKTAAEVLDLEREQIEICLNELQKEYEESKSGIRIRKINKSYQLVTAAENEEFIRKLCTPVKIKRLTKAALEVLAIIAYKQPVTKSAIDGIRGVRSDRVIEGLKDKDLIMEKGRSDDVGRPILYGTTDTFLMHFGFEDIKQLPEIYDFEKILDGDEKGMQISVKEIVRRKEEEI